MFSGSIAPIVGLACLRGLANGAGRRIKITVGILDGQGRLAHAADALHRGENAVLPEAGGFVETLHLDCAADEVGVVGIDVSQAPLGPFAAPDLLGEPANELGHAFLDLGLAGKPVAHASYLPADLVKLARPLQARFHVSGPTPDGYIEPKKPAAIRFWAGGLDRAGIDAHPDLQGVSPRRHPADV